MTAHAPRLPFSLSPLIVEARRRAMRRRTLIAVAVVLLAVTAAAAVIATRSPADRGRLDITVDASRSTFPADWRVAVQQSRAVNDTTPSGGRRKVPVAHSGGVFHLRGRGRYEIGVVVAPPDGMDGRGCAGEVNVNAADRYSATVRLIGMQCSVLVSRR